MREYIVDFCNEHNFPEEAKEVLFDIWDTLDSNMEHDNIFFQSIEKFSRDESQDYDIVFNELKRLAEDVHIEEYSLNLLLSKGRFVIEVHVPSGSPLYHEECLKSYMMAENYYRKLYYSTFGDQPIPFFIASWFMYSPMKDVFLPESNLMKFITDYDVIFQNPENNDADLWRVFGRDYQNSVECLSEKTTLQRNLKNGYLKEIT